MVDDHPAFVEGLRALIACDAGIEVVATAGTVVEAAATVAAVKPDVVLMDYRLPDGTGAAAAEQIRSSSDQPVAIVFLTATEDFDALYEAIDAGAVGYLLKSEAVDNILGAVHRAARGEVLIPPRVLAEVIREGRSRRRADQDRARVRKAMSPREMEVLRLMADGFDNQSIADELDVSYTTARAHVRNILSKLDAHSKLQAVARAAELELLPD